MNKYIKIMLVVISILVLMFCEYRFIMHNQSLEHGDNGTIYSTVFGITDTYYVEQDHTSRIMNDEFIDVELD